MEGTAKAAALDTFVDVIASGPAHARSAPATPRRCPPHPCSHRTTPVPYTHLTLPTIYATTPLNDLRLQIKLHGKRGGPADLTAGTEHLNVM